MTMLIVGSYADHYTGHASGRNHMDGRTLWIAHGDVEGDIEAGNVVKATRPLGDWCLRGDDGSAPVEAGTLLEIVELRPWGAAMAQELPEMHDELNVGDDDQRDAIMQAARELSDMGLFEIVQASC